MAYPFPATPVTAEVVADEVLRGGWQKTACPLCGDAAAIWRIDQRDAFRCICPRCQRFVVSGPHLAALRGDSDQVRERKRELSDAAARSVDVLDVG